MIRDIKPNKEWLGPVPRDSCASLPLGSQPAFEVASFGNGWGGSLGLYEFAIKFRLWLYRMNHMPQDFAGCFMMGLRV